MAKYGKERLFDLLPRRRGGDVGQSVSPDVFAAKQQFNTEPFVPDALGALSSAEASPPAPQFDFGAAADSGAWWPSETQYQAPPQRVELGTIGDGRPTWNPRTVDLGEVGGPPESYNAEGVKTVDLGTVGDEDPRWLAALKHLNKRAPWSQ